LKYVTIVLLPELYLFVIQKEAKEGGVANEGNIEPLTQNPIAG